MRNLIEFINATHMKFWLAKCDALNMCEPCWNVGKIFAPTANPDLAKAKIENFHCWMFEDPCSKLPPPYKLLDVHIKRDPKSSMSFVELECLTPEHIVHIESPVELSYELKDIIGVELSDDFVIKEILSRI